MSYIFSQLSKDRSEVLVWERDENNKRICNRYPAPYYFYIDSEKGDAFSIYDKRVARFEFEDSRIFFNTKKDLESRGIRMYESDIRPEYKILSEYYYNRQSRPLNIMFYDIEVDYNPEEGFSGPKNPYAPISAISMYLTHEKRGLVYVVPPKNSSWTEADLEKDDAYTVIWCKSEKEILSYFLEHLENVDVVSGWNSSGYDDAFVYERLKLIFGESTAERLSFPDAKEPYYKETMNKWKVPQDTLIISGRIFIDYMQLFIKFQQGNRDSYSLESVAEEELPDLPKIEYDGSLYDLYHKEFPKFVKYNGRDTIILKGLEAKFGYLQLAIEMAYMNTCQVADVLGTTKQTEMAIVNYCHHVINKVIPDSKKGTGTDHDMEGAFVVPTVVGQHDYVAAVDVTSLYPSTMRTLNISPETIVGQFYDMHAAFISIRDESDEDVTVLYENDMSETRTGKEWKIFLKENNWAISSIGTIYDQNVQGIIPSILSQWFSQRKEYQNNMAILEEESKKFEKNSSEYETISEKIKFFDRLQNIKKLSLNSLYGALGNAFFKFYDIRMGESTTKSGQEILLHMLKTVGLKIIGKYEYPNDAIVAGDTDSNYFLTHASNEEEGIMIGKYVQKHINNSFSKFLQDTFLVKSNNSNYVSVEFETMAKTSIFVKKKNYILHLCYKKGERKEDWKIMGVMLKKTLIPKNIRKNLTSFFKDFIKSGDYRNFSERIVNYRAELAKFDLLGLGLPKQIKGLEDYYNQYKNLSDKTNLKSLRLPGHVAASICWNESLKKYNDKESIPITSGMKIKVFYFKNKIKINEFKSIAIPTDLKILPKWFETEIVNKISIEDQLIRLIDSPVLQILQAINRKLPTNQTLLLDDEFEY